MFMTRPKKVMTGLIWRHKQDSFDLSVSTAGGIVLFGCWLLWAVVCFESSLVLDFVDVIAVAAFIMPCVDFWQ